MALGIILGPGVGGWLADDAFSRPFFVAAALSLVGLALIIVLLCLNPSIETPYRSGWPLPETTAHFAAR